MFARRGRCDWKGSGGAHHTRSYACASRQPRHVWASVDGRVRIEFARDKCLPEEDGAFPRGVAVHTTRGHMLVHLANRITFGRPSTAVFELNLRATNVCPKRT